MNAKDELIKNFKKGLKIKCAEIYFEPKDKEVLLKVDHSEEELGEFLSLLNFNYDNGYGEQELHGIVWFYDNVWLERGVYDGSEWWECKKTPVIPNKLKRDEDN